MPEYLKQILPLLKQNPQVGLAVLAMVTPIVLVKLEVTSGLLAFAFPVAIYSIYGFLELMTNRYKARMAAQEVRRIEVEGEARISSKIKRSRARLRKREND